MDNMDSQYQFKRTPKKYVPSPKSHQKLEYESNFGYNDGNNNSDSQLNSATNSAQKQIKKQDQQNLSPDIEKSKVKQQESKLEMSSRMENQQQLETNEEQLNQSINENENQEQNDQSNPNEEQQPEMDQEEDNERQQKELLKIIQEQEQQEQQQTQNEIMEDEQNSNINIENDESNQDQENFPKIKQNESQNEQNASQMEEDNDENQDQEQSQNDPEIQQEEQQSASQQQEQQQEDVEQDDSSEDQDYAQESLIDKSYMNNEIDQEADDEQENENQSRRSQNESNQIELDQLKELQRLEKQFQQQTDQNMNESENNDENLQDQESIIQNEEQDGESNQFIQDDQNSNMIQTKISHSGDEEIMMQSHENSEEDHKGQDDDVIYMQNQDGEGDEENKLQDDLMEEYELKSNIYLSSEEDSNLELDMDVQQNIPGLKEPKTYSEFLEMQNEDDVNNGENQKVLSIFEKHKKKYQSKFQKKKKKGNKVKFALQKHDNQDEKEPPKLTQKQIKNQNFRELLLQVPHFASQIDFDRQFKKIIVAFKNHYNFKKHLVENFEKFITILQNFPETQKKIVDEQFNFQYMDQLANGLKNDMDYLQKVESMLKQKKTDQVALQLKLRGEKGLETPIQEEFHSFIQQHQNKHKTNVIDELIRDIQLQEELYEQQQLIQEEYQQKQSKIPILNQLILDKHMLLKYRIDKGQIDDHAISRVDRASVTKRGKWTLTRFSDGEESDEDEKIFQKVKPLSDEEIQDYTQFCSKFIQDNDIEGFLYDPLDDNNNNKIINESKTAMNLSNKVFKIYDGTLVSKHHNHNIFLMSNGPFDQFKKFPICEYDRLESCGKIHVQPFMEYIQTIIKKRTVEQTNKVRYLVGWAEPKIQNEKNQMELKSFANRIIKKDKIPTYQWNEATKLYIIPQNFLNNDFALDVGLDPLVLSKHSVIYMVIFKKNRVSGKLKYVKPELMLNIANKKSKIQQQMDMSLNPERQFKVPKAKDKKISLLDAMLKNDYDSEQIQLIREKSQRVQFIENQLGRRTVERIKQLEEQEKYKKNLLEFRKRSMNKNSTSLGSTFKFDDPKYDPFQSAYRIPIRPDTQMPVFQRNTNKRPAVPHTPVQSIVAQKNGPIFQKPLSRDQKNQNETHQPSSESQNKPKKSTYQLDDQNYDYQQLDEYQYQQGSSDQQGRFNNSSSIPDFDGQSSIKKEIIDVHPKTSIGGQASNFNGRIQMSDINQSLINPRSSANTSNYMDVDAFITNSSNEKNAQRNKYLNMQLSSQKDSSEIDNINTQSMKFGSQQGTQNYKGSVIRPQHLKFSTNQNEDFSPDSDIAEEPEEFKSVNKVNYTKQYDEDMSRGQLASIPKYPDSNAFLRKPSYVKPSYVKPGQQIQKKQFIKRRNPYKNQYPQVSMTIKDYTQQEDPTISEEDESSQQGSVPKISLQKTQFSVPSNIQNFSNYINKKKHSTYSKQSSIHGQTFGDVSSIMIDEDQEFIETPHISQDKENIMMNMNRQAFNNINSSIGQRRSITKSEPYDQKNESSSLQFENYNQKYLKNSALKRKFQEISDDSSFFDVSNNKKQDVSDIKSSVYQPGYKNSVQEKNSSYKQLADIKGQLDQLLNKFQNFE